MPLITRNSQNANVKLGTTAQLAAITFTDGDLASDTTLNKVKVFNGVSLTEIGSTSFSSSAVVSQSTTIGDYTTPTAVVASSNGSPATGTIDYLVIGGGAQGAEGGGGGYGGNSGAINQVSGYSIALGSFAITIGSGGSGYLGNGSSSTFGAITAAGGTARGGTNGGGGDGVGGVGGAQTSLVGGVGGIGLASSITGSSLFYGGGGGGGGNFCSPNSRSGSLGGSGVGGDGPNGTDGGAAVSNRGSGGGGGGRAASCSSTQGGNGSAGIVIIKYTTGQVTATGGTITTSGGNTIHSFTSNGTFTISAFTGSSSFAIDDNTATKWFSSSSSNPNVYVDMGSALNLCAAAFYFDSTDTTNTEILIQSSADASTWTTRRTITESNLTNGAYNYYRFNIAGGARYIRFYGNSAGSTVLSIWEVKILKKTDAEIFNDLGILTITASDTALGPDGT